MNTKKIKIVSVAGLGILVAGAAAFYFSNNQSVNMSSLASRNVAGAVKNICSITINSNDEITSFKRKIGNDPRFQFTELVSSDDKWFNQACDSGVKCDVVIISGHFAEYFFGSSFKTLTLSELEAKSCARSCRGILENAKEVYLFGCNTLQSKGSSVRTPEEYFQVLLHDGYSRISAERIVEARYGPSGQQNLYRMRRAFTGVPAIYGFCDKAPLGEESGPIISSFLTSKVESYYDHLQKLENAQKTLQPYSDQTKAALQNIDLANKFKAVGRCFKQDTGADINDPIAKKICAIRNTSNSIESRAADLNSLMRSEESLSYIELCNDFFNEIRNMTLNPSQKAAVNVVRNNPALRSMLEQHIGKLTFGLSYDYAMLATDLGLEAQKVAPVLTAGFIKRVNDGLTLEEASFMINKNVHRPLKNYIRIQYSDLTEAAWSNPNVMRILGITATKDPQILDRLKTQLLQTTDNHIRENILEAMISLGLFDQSMKYEFVRMLKDSDSNVRANAIRMLTELGKYDEQVINEIINLVSYEKENWVLKKAMFYFIQNKFNTPTVVAFLTRTLNNPSAEAREYAALALGNLDVNQATDLANVAQCMKDASPAIKDNCRFVLRRNAKFISPALRSQIESYFPADVSYIFGK